MWRSNFTIALRTLAANRTYAFVNVFGLALGLAACILLFLYVRHETSFDRWLPNAENIYQLQSSWVDPQTGNRVTIRMSQHVAGTTLQSDFPNIEKRVHAEPVAPVVLRDGEALKVAQALSVDGPFFDIFQLPFAAGEPATALDGPNTAVLCESEALRIFGGEAPLGKTLTVAEAGGRSDYRVSGIMKDLPKNSHMRFTMVLRPDPPSLSDRRPAFASWKSGWGYTYFQLRPRTDVDALRAQLPAWERRNILDRRFGDRIENEGEFQDWKLVNVADIHLGEARMSGMRPGNERATITTFMTVALLILCMACVNFTNLATARASVRAREIAIRKVLGATRGRLIAQLLTESVFTTAIATVVALAFVEPLAPLLSETLDADIELRYFGENGILPHLLLLTAVVGVAAGLYPAIYLSRFPPARILKANRSVPEPAGTGRLRNALVVGQFSVSIGLIICTAVVYAQTLYARTLDPGYVREGLLQIDAGSRAQLPALDAVKEEIARLPGVRAVSRTSVGIATPLKIGSKLRSPKSGESLSLGNYPVDEQFFDAMGIPIVAGRKFDPGRPLEDTSLPYPVALPQTRRPRAGPAGSVILNQLAARQLGYRDPRDALGRQLSVPLSDDPSIGMARLTVVGIVGTSRFGSLRQPVEPIMYRLAREHGSHLVVRYDGPDPQGFRDDVGRIWKRLAPDLAYDARFADEIVGGLYQAEEARAKTFGAFAGLAVAIACLGLLGLAAFTAERRSKEIGVRKVMGARSADIMRLMAWQVSKPVLVSNLIAWPAAWWVMRDWLARFDSSIALEPAPFVTAGFGALVVALATVTAHCLRTACLHPVHALRYE